MDNRLLSRIERSFKLPLSSTKKIIKSFHSEMSKGLSGGKSSLAMLPAFIGMPAGDEAGRFIVLDLGGTNFRVQEVVLEGGGKAQVTAENRFGLKKKDITGTGKELFDFIAGKIKDFMQIYKISPNEKRCLGFTFSFPMDQTDITNGSLIRWTKEFSATGVVGRDVVSLLESALKRKGVNNIRVAALLNDTVGTLLAKGYTDRECDLGVILGTGTNASYPEDTVKIRKWRGAKKPARRMLINMEWGNFNKLPRTVYDERLDRATSNSGMQTMEKMVSGFYLGEITRLISLDLIKKKALFSGDMPAAFARPGRFGAREVFNMERDNSKRLNEIGKILTGLGISRSTHSDRGSIKRICRVVKVRSAHIGTAAMAAVILWMDPKIERRHTIAIDGSLFEKSPGYRKYIKLFLRNLLGIKADRIKLALANGGSGKGAAIAAAIINS